MNNVILFMWLGDVSGNMQNAISLITGAWAIGSGIMGVVIWLGTTDNSVKSETAKLIFKRWTWTIIPAMLLVLVGGILPNKDTMRLAAALSAGKAVAETQLGQKAAEAANAVLDRIIVESKK